MSWFRATVHVLAAVRTRKFEANLGGDDDPAADRLESLSNDVFVSEWALYLCRVEKGDAAVMGGADQRDGLFGICRRSVSMAQPHAAKTQCRDFEATDFSLLHF